MHDGQGAPRRRGCTEDWRDGSLGIKCVYTATGNSWQDDGCPDTRRGPKVSMSCLPPCSFSLSPFVLPKMMSHWLYTCSMLTGQRERSFCSAGEELNDFMRFLLPGNLCLPCIYWWSEYKSFYTALIWGIESLKQYWPTKPVYITCSGTQGIKLSVIVVKCQILSFRQHHSPRWMYHT